MLLTGMRKSDALNLDWNSIDLKTSVIRYQAIKNRKICVVPLVGYTGGDISPTLAKLMKVWDNLSGNDKFVLPHPKSIEPSELKRPLINFRDSINETDLTFQNLRKTFVSYAVTFGIPPATVAFWVGHSPAVAEKHYMEFSQTQIKGKNIEEIMGVSEVLKTILNGYQGKGDYSNLKLTMWQG